MLSPFSSLSYYSPKAFFARSFAQAASQSVKEEIEKQVSANNKKILDDLKSPKNANEPKNVQPQAEKKEEKKEEPPKPTYQELENKVKELTNQNLYLLADVENTRRRFERLSHELETTAVVSIAKKLLPVADNIKRIQESGSKQPVSSLLEAVAIIDSELHSIFKAFKIIRLDSKGQKFNPEFHDAIATISGKPEDSGKVLDVINEGYTIDGKLLRAAKVVVVK